MPTNTTTRSEHMKWCKKRALEALDNNDAPGALASMLSDLGKHPETEDHIGIRLAGTLLVDCTVDKVRKWVEDFG